MTFLFINFVLAAVPAVALLIYFYRRDKQKKEPFSLIWKTFAFGFLAVIPAGLIELFVDAFFSIFTAGWMQSFFKAFVVAALIEESLKLAVVFIFVYKRTEFDEVTDGIVYTITASLGFAFLENLLYSFGPPYVLILRGITAVHRHSKCYRGNPPSHFLLDNTKKTHQPGPQIRQRTRTIKRAFRGFHGGCSE